MVSTERSLGRIVGYARVSTDDQTVDPQRRPLRDAGCTTIYQDVASGADRERPELARCLASLGAGDTLVIVRLDRLARSLQHLLEIVTDLKERGIEFRSLSDQIDTSTPQGRFMFHMLGAFAEFERDLIRERTMAGLAAARIRGSKPGNPLLRRRDPAAIANLKIALADTNLRKARVRAAPWRDLLVSLRPGLSWKETHARIRKAHPGAPSTIDAMRSIARKLAHAGDIPRTVLDRASPPTASQLAPIAKAIKDENPSMPNREIAKVMDRRGIHPLRGSSWTSEAVGRLLRIAATTTPPTTDGQDDAPEAIDMDPLALPYGSATPSASGRPSDDGKGALQ